MTTINQQVLPQPIHLQPLTAIRKAQDGILQLECTGCHILIDTNVHNTPNMPHCKNCGETIWLYNHLALALLHTNGHFN